MALFDEILAKGVRAGQIPGRTDAAKKWYRKTAGEYSKINETTLMKSSGDRLTSTQIVGNCYMYFYDAKHKSTLPYYDRFPLVFPYKKVPGDFMGINLHYLPLIYRAKLMDALYDTTNNDAFDKSTKLRLNYSILDKAAKFRYFKPCVKHYLSEQVRSRFLYVYPSEWDIALFLPTQRFIGATKEKVWKDSLQSVGGNSASTL